MQDQANCVQGEEGYEQQEEFMVSVPDAVVNECAVMVETFNTFIAVVAMPCFLGS